MWNHNRRHTASTRDLFLRIGRAVPDVVLGFERSMARSRGIEFHGLREFQDSDSPRDIDWAASARLSDDDTELMSREFMPEYQIRVLVVADEHTSMRHPAQKPLYASALVKLFGMAAFASENRYKIIGVGGGDVVSSDWMLREDELDAFLADIDEPRQRKALRVYSRTLEASLEEMRLRNTLVVFLTDLCELNRVPLGAIRTIDPARNVKSIAVVLDEWSGFAPTSNVLALQDPESSTIATLDMRRGGGVEREVNAFRARLEELKRSGKSCGLAVATVPLVEEDPLRVFCKHWQRIMNSEG